MTLSQTRLEQSLAANCLYLILFSSESCNFRCRYCYENFDLGRMQPSVVEGLKKFLSRRAADLDRLTLSWFGGEPLLALNVIKDVHNHTRSLLNKKSNIHFGANMNTNGYLLSREIFEELLSLGVTGYQISFDGPQEWHDQKRVLANGKGTFDRIWENLKTFKEVRAGFTVILRVHVDKDNQEAIPDFLSLCKETFEGDNRFQLFIRPLSRLGGAEDEKLRVLDGGMKDKGIDALRGMAACQGLAQYQDKMPSRVCYASTANCFLVRADGRINKCTVALEHPGNQVGRLNPDGTLDLDKQLMLKWMRGLCSKDARELHCPLNDFPMDS